jgi:uncharacterized membrane protein YeaQ/YmgE (transglycosylase-associated protein family)
VLVIDLNALGTLISDSQKSSALSFAAWIGIGLLVGFIGSTILNKTGRGVVRDVLLGICRGNGRRFCSQSAGEAQRFESRSLQLTGGGGWRRGVYDRLSRAI